MLPHFLAQERQESRCSLILDSCTFAWQTGHVTITAAEEEAEAMLEEEEAMLEVEEAMLEDGPEEAAAADVAVCCAADGWIFSLGSLLIVFWKKSKMEAELLCMSHVLFLDAPSLLELLKHLDSVGSAGPPCDPFKTTDEDLSEPAFGVLESQLATAEVSADVSEGFLKPNKSSIDFCRAFVASLSLALLRDLWIFTGEPLMLTKTLVLATDFFTDLPEAAALRFPLSSRLERTGEPRALFGDEGVNSFLGEKTELGDEVLATGATCLWEAGEEVEDCEFPPSTKPLPLNGIRFLLSCNPEQGR